MLLMEYQRRFSIVGLGNDVKFAPRVQHVCQPGSHDGMVIHEEQAK